MGSECYAIIRRKEKDMEPFSCGDGRKCLYCTSSVSSEKTSITQLSRVVSEVIGSTDYLFIFAFLLRGYVPPDGRKSMTIHCPRINSGIE